MASSSRLTFLKNLEYEMLKQKEQCKERLKASGLSRDEICSSGDFKTVSQNFWNVRLERAKAEGKNYPVSSGEEFWSFSKMHEFEMHARDKARDAAGRHIDTANHYYHQLREIQQGSCSLDIPFVQPPSLEDHAKVQCVSVQASEEQTAPFVNLSAPRAYPIGFLVPKDQFQFTGSSLLEAPLCYLPPGMWLAQRFNLSLPVSLDLYIQDLRISASKFGDPILADYKIRKAVLAFQRFLDAGQQAVASQFMINHQEKSQIALLGSVNKLLCILHYHSCQQMGRSST